MWSSRQSEVCLPKMGSRSVYNRVVKRVLDVLVALVLSIPAALLVGLCVLAVKLESPGPAFFCQERPGKDGRIFRMYKLRSMIVETTRNGRALGDMERMTRSGRIMRACSLDELPQLWNILRGDMSFVGPRPLLVSYLPLYSPQQRRRHEVRPGISGWAQVNGRNLLSWEEKFKLDVWYVDHVSLGLDMKIFWLTIRNVFRRDGINADGEDTMPDFQGETGGE